MARVTGIHRLGLRVPELGAVSDFYFRNWGMGRAGGQGDERLFQSRASGHPDLSVRKSDAVSGLDYVTLSVNSAGDLDAILSNVQAAGFSVAHKPVPGERPGDALVAAVNDVDGNRIELVVPSRDPVKPPERPEGPAIGPQKLGHVVLWTPQIEKQEAFYLLLGFQVSDRTHVGMSFLRCNADHHTIALLRSGRSRTGLQHAAYDVGSLDTVMREFGRLRAEGIACIWGVGRHGPGNNVFSYYRDPANNVVEYYGDMEVVPAEGKVDVRIWGPEHRGDIWGVAGAPPEPFRD